MFTHLYVGSHPQEFLLWNAVDVQMNVLNKLLEQTETENHHLLNIFNFMKLFDNSVALKKLKK